MTAKREPQLAYRFGDLPAYLGLQRTQLREMIKHGEFPKGTLVSPRSKTRVWFADQLVRWQESRRSTASAA